MILENVNNNVGELVGRQSQGYAGNAGKNQALRARVVNTVRNAGANQPRVVRCYNCNGEGQIAKQCTAKIRVKDSEWFMDKMLLAYHVNAYDSDCDDEATTNAIFMENLSHVFSINDDMVEPHYGSDILSESYDELMSNSNVISYTDYMLTIRNDEDNYVPHPVQKNDIMLSVIKQMKSQVEKCNMVNKEKQSENESLTSELE
ncbi:reverse transcriptase domain-containing protein [Tanacetum coccineum]|uniref:Reverse transcriptase domain-containing protein n=1 Tax=Tanacetum coccineum TaxID=301880 RepID=A0ABQ5B6X3_9ASTR